MVLTKSHQQLVYLYPIFKRKFFSQRHLGFFRGLCFDITPAITDAVHMGINAYSRLAKTKCNYQIGGLAPHPFELQKVINFFRYAATVLRYQLPGYCKYLHRLVPVESGRIDQFPDFSSRKLCHGSWCPRTLEQACRSCSSYLILCTQGDNAGYQYFVGTVLALRYNRNGWCPPCFVLFTQNSDYCMNVFCFQALTLA